MCVVYADRTHAAIRRPFQAPPPSPDCCFGRRHSSRDGARADERSECESSGCARRPAEPNSGQHLDAGQWQSKVEQLSTDYLHFMDDLGEHVPIIAHGYDYMPPSNKGVKYDGFRVTGPWVLPAMIAKNITDVTLQRALVKEMMNDFNDILAKMQAKYPLNFIHVDLRGMFVESDWLNEIHLKQAGFKRVAQAFMDAIDNRLPAVQQARKDAGL